MGLRIIDFRLQLAIVAGMSLSVALFFYAGFFGGLLLLGMLQLLSAGLNTKGFQQHGFAKEIGQYWIGTALLCLPGLFAILAGDLYTTEGGWIALLVSWIGALLLAGYYLWIYQQLISVIRFRRELEGLIRAKH